MINKQRLLSFVKLFTKEKEYITAETKEIDPEKEEFRKLVNADTIIESQGEFNMIIYILCNFKLWVEMDLIITKYKQFISVGTYVHLITFYCNTDNVELAISMLKNIKNTKDNHYRFYSPILNFFCLRDTTKALTFYKEYLQETGLIINIDDYYSLINIIQKDKLGLNKYEDIIKTILLSQLTIQHECINVNKWFGILTTVNENGKCNNCKNSLEIKDISSLDKQEIIKKLFVENCSITYEYDVVVDGANVGFFDNKGNDKYIDFNKIVKIVNMTKQLGYKNPLIVLHSRHKKHDRTGSLTPFQVYYTPKGFNDDYFWLYFTIIKNCHLVTNDKLRDHSFSTLKQKQFERWKSCHVIEYDLNKLKEIKNYTKCIQQNNNNWHFPVNGTDNLYCLEV